MAARIGALRSVNAVRGLSAWGTRLEKVGVKTDILNSCRRCLSVATPLYQKYLSADHEWITVDDGIGTVGITHHAQEALGDLVYVEVTELDNEVDKDDVVGTVESVKAASDVLSPVSGKVIEVNSEVESVPETVNKSPEADGWLFKIQLSDSSELDELMSEEQYEKFLAEALE